MYTFKKEERLCNKRLIAGLYHKGSSFLCYPFKVSWMPVTDTMLYPVQVVFSVPKKRYKHATDRNLIKRRTREAYRLHKQQYLYAILAAADVKLILSLTYIGKEIADYTFIEKKIVKLFNQLCEDALR